MRRFDKGPCYMEENDDGRYVLHSDHAAELARVEGERDANRRLLNKALKGNTLLRAECEAWRKWWDAELPIDLNKPDMYQDVACARQRADAAGALKGGES